MNTHMEPVLEVVASIFLLNKPVKNDKRVFILFASVQSQYLKGMQNSQVCCPPWQKTFTKASRTEHLAASQPSNTVF